MKTNSMNINVTRFAAVVAASISLCAGEAWGTDTNRNLPPKCKDPDKKCDCPGQEVENGCIKVTIDLGETTPWTGSIPCELKIFADNDSPSIFTADSLYAILGGYTFKRLGTQNLSDGTTPAEVVLSRKNGEAVHFVFRDGESMAQPDPSVHIKMDERLQMVDAEGWATASDPVYYDLYVGDGTKRRFLATDMTGALGSLVSLTDARGVAVTPADMGVDIVYDSNGVRQFLTPSRLADITSTADFSGYDVTVYALQDPPTIDAQTRLYPLPAGLPVEVISIRRENNGKRAVVTQRKGGGETKRYVFDYAMGDWSLRRPSGMEERKERYIADEKDAKVIEESISSAGVRLSRTEYNYKWESWGFALTNKVEGFDGLTNITTWTYYTSGNGKGQVKTEMRQSGLLIQYAYDNVDRVISETRSGPGMMTETTAYDYTPVEASDPVLPVDTRPRTVVKTLDGIECERTYYVYSPLTNIVERVGTQGALYGSTNVLRAVTAFYPAVANDVRSGLVASIRHEDGKLDVYDYALTSNLWVETVTHLHEQSPAPVSGKTTRDITTTNRRGEILEQKTEAFIDGSWYTIARDRMTYNTTGKRIRTENLAGQVTTTAWDCCHKVSEVQPDGSTTTWDYDNEGRMIASSRLVPLDMTNVTWLTTCYEYDDLGRQVATWQTNYSAQVGLPATRTRYDQLGRVIARVDQLGNTTTTEYSQDGRTVSVRNPNTSTRVTARSASGDALSITGSAVTPEFHTYGISPDGTRWSRTVQGETASSPRFTKRYENLLGQTIREERSGFQGAALASVQSYDSLGRLVSTSADYEPSVEYTYDVLGNRVATTRTVGIPRAEGESRSDALAGVHGDPAAPQSETTEWRKSESLSHIAIIDGDVWLIQTNIVSCSDSTIAPLVTSSARQLTGLTAALPARSHTTDIRGNVTVNEMLVDSSIVTSRQTVPYATNKPLSFSRYGVLLMDVSVSAVTNTVAYDALGRQIDNTDGRGNTRRTEYNSFGQRSASIDALGNRTTYAYDQFGNLASVTDPLGNATVYEYDLRGLKTYEGGATYPVRYTYDIFGNKTTMMTYRNESLGPDSGDVTTWLYDEASGSMTNKSYADGKGPTYTYTPTGRLASRIWARGIVTYYYYNGWGNLTNIVYSDTTPTVSVAYDDLGRQTEARDSAGVTTFIYDVFGSITNESEVSVSGTNTIERYWDGCGRTIGYALNGNRQTTIVYEPDKGRIASMLVNGATNAFYWSYYGGSDLKSQLKYPNGLTVSWQYDPNSQLLQVCNATRTNIISQYNYIYDAAGRHVQMHRSGTAMSENRTDIYDYNARNEITFSRRGVAGVENETVYAYDDIGNRISSLGLGTNCIYIANNLNQYISISNFCVSLSARALSEMCDGEFIPQFDENGNQTLIQTSTGVWQIQYNGENRPAKWLCVSTNSTTFNPIDHSVVIMSYDRNGRRITKNNQRFIYNDYLQIADNDGNAYIWDPTETALTRPLVKNIRGRILYYTYDKNKNVSEVVSDDALINSFAYDEYGSVSVLAGDRTIRDGYGFSAEWFDSYLGLLYYNYRHYNPLVGRWVCRDPIGEMGGVNLYQAFDNNPIMAVDILGYASHLDCEKQKSNWEKLLDENNKSSLRMLWNRMSENKECTIPPIECKCCDGDKRKDGGYWNSADRKITICENNLPKEKNWTAFGSILSHELVHAAQSLCFKWNNSDCRTSVCREIQAYSIQFGIPLNTRKNRSEIEKGVLFSSRCACAKEVVPNWDKDKSCDENISGHEDAVARRIKTEFDALYSSCVHRVGKPSVLAK